MVFDSWRRWPVETGLNDKVIAFLAWRPDYLHTFDSAGEDLAFATPRSWEMAARVLDGLGGDAEAAFPLISDLVGTGMATEFLTWSKVYGQLPDIRGIFAGKERRVPKDADALYALVSAITQYARTCKDNLDAMGHSIEYAMRLPADYSVVLLKDNLYLEQDYKSKLLHIPQFVEWMSTKGALLNGIV